MAAALWQFPVSTRLMMQSGESGERGADDRQPCLAQSIATFEVACMGMSGPGHRSTGGAIYACRGHHSARPSA